jgi:transposase-like protein
MTKKKEEVRPVGRPSEYEADFCGVALSLGKQGVSWTGIANELGFSRETLYRWIDTHPEFSDAMKRSRESAQAWWETTLRAQATGEANGSATSAIFAMKNQFPEDYRDRKEHQIDAEVGVFEIDFTGFDGNEEADAESGEE